MATPLRMLQPTLDEVLKQRNSSMKCHIHCSHACELAANPESDSATVSSLSVVQPVLREHEHPSEQYLTAVRGLIQAAL
jgi:hypothetical protein